MKIETDFNVVWSAWDDDSDPDENRVQGHGMTEWTAINDLVEKLIDAALEKNPNGTSQVGGERQRAIKEPGQSTSALRYPGSNPGDDPAPSDSALTVAQPGAIAGTSVSSMRGGPQPSELGECIKSVEQRTVACPLGMEEHHEVCSAGYCTVCKTAKNSSFNTTERKD